MPVASKDYSAELVKSAPDRFSCLSKRRPLVIRSFGPMSAIGTSRRLRIGRPRKQWEVKRTSLAGAGNVEDDPNRKWRGPFCCGAQHGCLHARMRFRREEKLDETARIHHACWQRGCDMAACGTCAAARPDAVNRRAGGLCGERFGCAI